MEGPSKSTTGLYLAFGLALCFITGLIYFVQDHAFFWDTLLLTSKYADHFFDTSFQSVLLPADLDAGHPPFWGMYIASTWKAFGRSLIVSHWAMWPFLVGILWQMVILVQHFFPDQPQVQIWVFFLLLLEPTWLGQAALVSSDIPFLFCYLLAFNGLLDRTNLWVIIGSTGLVLLSLRALPAVLSLGLFSLFLAPRDSWTIPAIQKIIHQNILGFGLASLVAGAYFLFHWWETGWLFTTPSENWAGQRDKASGDQILKNIAVLGWRLLDFGKIALWVILLPLLTKYLFINKETKPTITILLYGIFCFTLAYVPILILGTNPIGHRYLLPLFLMIALLTAALIQQFISNPTYKVYLFSGIYILLISGHFWVYPKQISQGWDASLAHLPYHSLRLEMLDSIEQRKIPFDQIGTEFPLVGERHHVDLFPTKSPILRNRNLEKDPYLLFSTVQNDFTDEELEYIDSHFKSEIELRNGQMTIQLLKRTKH